MRLVPRGFVSSDIAFYRRIKLAVSASSSDLLFEPLAGQPASAPNLLTAAPPWAGVAVCQLPLIRTWPVPRGPRRLTSKRRTPPSVHCPPFGLPLGSRGWSGRKPALRRRLRFRSLRSSRRFAIENRNLDISCILSIGHHGCCHDDRIRPFQSTWINCSRNFRWRRRSTARTRLRRQTRPIPAFRAKFPVLKGVHTMERRYAAEPAGAVRTQPVDNS